MPELTARSLGKTEIFLEWTAPASNGSPITDYDLQRWDPTGDGGWPAFTDAPNADEGDLLGATDTTVTLFLDADLTPGITYLYRIRAQNGENRAGAWSTLETTAATVNAGTAESATTAADVPGRTTWGGRDDNGAADTRSSSWHGR